MLIRFFSSVRNKPKEVRDQYAFWIAALITAAVAVPWVFGLPEKLDMGQSGGESEPIFSSFLNEATGRLSEVTEQIGDVSSLEEPAEPSAGGATTTEVDMSFITNDSTPVVAPTESPVVQREVRIATTSASTTQ